MTYAADLATSVATPVDTLPENVYLSEYLTIRDTLKVVMAAHRIKLADLLNNAELLNMYFHDLDILPSVIDIYGDQFLHEGSTADGADLLFPDVSAFKF